MYRNRRRRARPPTSVALSAISRRATSMSPPSVATSGRASTITRAAPASGASSGRKQRRRKSPKTTRRDRITKGTEALLQNEREDGRGLREPGPSVDPKTLPGLVVYDLDDTVWFPELYMIAGAPFTKIHGNAVEDVMGDVVRVYAAARRSIAQVYTHDAFRRRGTKIAVASRTHRGKWARELMQMFEIIEDEDGVSVSLADCAPLVDIAAGTKTKHFQRLRERTGVAYGDMLFFDNERVNVDEVARMGVRCVHCPGGVSAEAHNRGLRLFVEDTVPERLDEASSERSK
jgi:magnesium-dependent phosphatase 1